MPFLIFIILLQLKNLNEDATNNQGKFWKSYGKWISMSNEQRIKSLLFFQKLEPNKQTLVANKAKQLESQAASEKSIRAEITTQNDRTRLLHIYAHPTLSTYVTKALQLKDREELDNPSSENPYEVLAEAFNNQELVFQNKALVYVDGQPNIGIPAAGCEGIYDKVYKLDPNSPLRSVRDSGWIAKHLKELRTNLSVIRRKFSLSGNQDAENINTEWDNFAQSYGDVYSYAILVITFGDMDTMGKMLPEALQKDSGASGLLATKNKKRQLDRKQEMQGSASKMSSSSPALTSTKSDSNLEKVLDKNLKTSTILQALMFLANRGDSNAMKKIEELAYGVENNGLQMPTTNHVMTTPLNLGRNNIDSV